MKILVISNYNSLVTVRPEAEMFIGLQVLGHQVTIMTYGGSEYVHRFRTAGVKVIEYHPQRKFSLEAINRIRKELKEGGHDILHVFNSKGMTNSLFAVMWLPVKLVFYRGYTGNIHWYDPFMYIKYLNPRVDGIMCLVEAIREIFQKNLLFGKEKAVTINKGHNVDWYQDVKPVAIRQELGIDEDALVLVCAANSRPMKGVRYLLKATHLLSAEIKIHLLLAGNGMDIPEFKELISQSPIKNKIHILGFRKDILGVVKSADVFVLASIKGEAITKAVIEAMCLGITPLITDIPGNKGLVINNETGLVVQSKSSQALADGISKLYNDRSLIEKFGPEARKHIQTKFNTKETVINLEQFYQKLLTSK